MKDKIHIASWLLTRKCNLQCSYCGISRNPRASSRIYPRLSDYIAEEMKTETVISGLYDMKKHNPDMFHIFYGGEPLLRKDLYKIINFCNDSNIHYTIITNNTEEVQPLLNKLFDKVEYVSGLTSSVDPLLYDKAYSTDDRVKKTYAGFKRLVGLKNKVKDLVAEITVSKDNIQYLYQLVKDLTKEGISSDITFVDVAKNEFYDFSNVIDGNQLVFPTDEVHDILMKIYDDKLNVHLHRNFIENVFGILPAKLDCKLEEGIHNITIDADGTVRLCLRIRGTETPRNINIHNMFIEKDLIETLIHYQAIDKHTYCLGCNWTCIIMSQMIRDSLIISEELIHKKVRQGE